MKRKNFSHLPDAKTLDKALTKEAVRAIPEGKEGLNLPVFSLFESWMKKIGVSLDFWELTVWQELINQGNKLRQEVVRKTLRLIDKENQSFLRGLTEVENYLGENDSPAKSDVIFVFGSRDLGRIRKGASFWKKGLSSLILITGRSRYDSTDQTEAGLVASKGDVTGQPNTKQLQNQKDTSTQVHAPSGRGLDRVLSLRSADAF